MSALGTVYRNLPTLAGKRRNPQDFTGVGPDRFDGCIDPHYLFLHGMRCRLRFKNGVN